MSVSSLKRLAATAVLSSHRDTVFLVRPVNLLMADLLRPSALRETTSSTCRRDPRKPQYGVPVLVLKVVSQASQDQRRWLPCLVSKDPWP